MLKTLIFEHEIDRSNWPSGQWDFEPDKIQWESAETNLPCLMVRNTLGNWCGYVGIPKGHPCFEKNYDDVNVEVHGGLTYAGYCHGRICHIDENTEENSVWWLGFDCAHCDDSSPGMAKYSYGIGVYRDQMYVEEEVASLARQLKNYA